MCIIGLGGFACRHAVTVSALVAAADERSHIAQQQRPPAGGHTLPPQGRLRWHHTAGLSRSACTNSPNLQHCQPAMKQSLSSSQAAAGCDDWQDGLAGSLLWHCPGLRCAPAQLEHARDISSDVGRRIAGIKQVNHAVFIRDAGGVLGIALIGCHLQSCAASKQVPQALTRAAHTDPMPMLSAEDEPPH